MHPICSRPHTQWPQAPWSVSGYWIGEDGTFSRLKKSHLADGHVPQVIFTQLISRIPPRDRIADQSLIIVHRKELVEQAAHHCRLAYPDKTVEIEMGKNKASGAADITIASIQSLLSKDRIQKFVPDRFKLILVDEAHHIVSPSYREVLRHFGLDQVSDDSPYLVGVSATFFRFDGLKLGAAIDHIVYHKDYVDMIEEKWLADAVFTTVKSEADLSRVRKDKFGDFAIGQLSEAVNTATTNNITVRAWLANASDRRSTLVFCVDTEHVRRLTDTFREHGIDARYITASTPSNVRNEQLQAFKNQEYPVLLNCGLFTEGTDIPNVDCVLLARPTRSKSLLIQMIGRGLRLSPGKKNCHVIDMVASLRTGVISAPTLFGLDPDEVLNKSSVKQLEAMRNGSPHLTGISDSDQPLGKDDVNVTFTKYDSILDLLSDQKSEQHIRSLSSNAWVRVDQHRYVLGGKTGWVTIDKEGNESEGQFQVRFVQKFEDEETGRSVHTRPRIVGRAPDLEQAVHAADTFANGRFGEHAIAAWQPWRRLPASPAQLNFLNKKRLREHNLKQGELTRGQAADIITKLRFGTKKRFETERKKRERSEAARQEFEELQRRGDVKVGPLNQST
jgi:ATP-dependent helicase IRC3